MYVSDVRKTRYRGKTKPTIQKPHDVFRLLGDRLKDRDREHFFVVLLTTKNAVIGIETVSVGTLNASLVHPREVFKPAIVQSAAAVVLVHNHPSGDPAPSAEDVELTRRMADAGGILGIEVLDHVIIAGARFTSLREAGAL